MDRYVSTDCPICGKPLFNKDNVVCPTCGAPYHRECFFGNGGECIFPELHESNESWKPPVKEDTKEDFEKSPDLHCSRCGTVNPKNGLFCQVCGNQLNDVSANDNLTNGSNPNYGQTPPSFGGMGGGFIPPGMPLNPFTTPFGGVAPDDVIDEVPAKDLAIFVGRNSHYYLPAFKAISSKKSKVVNWSAFFFQGGFFLYRKMYGTGILLFLLTTLLSIPSTLVLYQNMSTMAELSYNIPIGADTLSNLTIVANLLGLALRLTCGLFANTVYKSHCYSKIKAEKEKNLAEPEYLAALSKKGSVALKLITGLLVAYMVFTVFSMFAMLLMGY